jgi:hypothetical protein
MVFKRIKRRNLIWVIKKKEQRGYFVSVHMLYKQ